MEGTASAPASAASAAELQRIARGAAAMISLDDLAEQIASPQRERGERRQLLRRFQRSAAALPSPEREQRLAQLDQLIARHKEQP